MAVGREGQVARVRNRRVVQEAQEDQKAWASRLVGAGCHFGSMRRLVFSPAAGLWAASTNRRAAPFFSVPWALAALVAGRLPPADWRAKSLGGCASPVPLP